MNRFQRSNRIDTFVTITVVSVVAIGIGVSHAQEAPIGDCWTLVSDGQCGADSVGDSLLCTDSEGNETGGPNSICTSAPRSMCSMETESGKDGCRLVAEEQYVQGRCDIYQCVDGVYEFVETVYSEPCSTHELWGDSCGGIQNPT